MTESEFLQLIESTLRGIEDALERAMATVDVDVECNLAGNILEIEFMEKGTKIIINSQSPMRELWVAAPSGGHHFRFIQGCWTDTRSAQELYATLSAIVSFQIGKDLVLVA